MIEINKVDRTEAPRLAELQTETFKQAYDGVHTEADLDAYCEQHYTAERASSELLDQKTSCYFGWVDSELAGYYLVKNHPSPISLPFSAIELKQIYVLSRAYGTGLGKALFAHASQIAGDLGANGIWLVVSNANDRARAFYEKLGFVKVGVGPILEVGDDELTSSVLALQLKETE